MGAVRNSNTRASHASVEMKDVKGTGSNQKEGPDSPRALADAPDRRSSFSYLRRASDRRRRRRLMSGANQYMDDYELNNSSKSKTHFHNGEKRVEQPSQRQTLQAPKLQVEGEPDLDQEQAELEPEEEQQQGTEEWLDEEGEWHEDQDRPSLNEYDMTPIDQRRTSVSDRLTEAVSDAVEFVREESFKRHKRRSMIRKRLHQSGTGSGQVTGTDEGGTEMDSEGPGLSAADRAASYRRRRLMRRSPRRAQQSKLVGVARQATASGVYNDSDTGSLGSVTIQHPMTSAISLDHTERAPYRQIPDRQMSAAYPTTSRYGVPYADENMETMQLGRIGPIPMIPVGSSPPPPPPGSVEAELAAARRRREEMEAMRGGEIGTDPLNDDSRSVTAIHLEDPTEDQEKGVGDKPIQPVRFIAPKVAPLQSPSDTARSMPGQGPSSGRRLPQIPGSSIFKSAAGFLQSSIYGSRAQARGSGGSPVVAGTVLTGSMEEVEFPLVSESPTCKREFEDQPMTRAIVKGHSTEIDEPGQTIQFPRVSYSPTPQPMSQPGPRQAGIGQASFHQPGQFHVNRNLTAGPSSQPVSSSAQSMIATHQDGTQSTVLAPTSSNVDSRAWISLSRRSRRDNDGNEWF